MKKVLSLQLNNIGISGYLIATLGLHICNVSKQLLLQYINKQNAFDFLCTFYNIA